MQEPPAKEQHAPAPRILIVDDYQKNIELVTFILEEEHFDVRGAGSAAQALETIPVFQPHLILMDLQMPGMNGLELTRKLKSEPATRDIVVLAFTAMVMPGDDVKAFSAGCDGYVSKPVDVDTLAQTLRSHLPASLRDG
jgi:two-component system cell cycle response regulator DivK